MHIDVLKLKNCKGFEEVTLQLKPLTLLLGPNSSGKSTFCKMLVALSKIHKKAKADPCLQFTDEDKLDLGAYGDLVHSEKSDSPVVIGVGVPNGYIELGFGGGKELEKAGIFDTALTNLRILDKNNFSITNDISKDSSVNFPTSNNIDWNVLYKVITDEVAGDTFTRKTVDTWSGPRGQLYELSFEGLRLKRVLSISGGMTVSAEYQRTPFHGISTILNRTSYLRPDRESPRRIYYRHTENRKTSIGDRGEGTAWYLHENWEFLVSTYRYFEPTSDIKAAKRQLEELADTAPEKNIKLGDALSFWLHRLGLLSHVETSIPIEGQNQLAADLKNNIGVYLRGKVSPKAPLKDLSDIGFGVSQVLPVLVAGLVTPSDGLFVVEQPEAELHPLPQAELADFFCSMVKCGQSVLIETHSEEIFHRLRLRAEQDADLASKIAVYFIDAPGINSEGNFGCKTPKPIALNEGAEFNWPEGFLSYGIEIEQQIRAARVAKEKKGDKG